MEKIKKIFLLIYVIAGVVLILLVWYQGINVNTTLPTITSTPTESYYVISTVTPTLQTPIPTVQPEASQPSDQTPSLLPSTTPGGVSGADATATFIQMGIDE
jgi:hypothetical protein